MKKYLNYIAGCLLLGAVASCSDAPDELTSVDYDRLFSPTEIDTRIRNAVDVTVSWNAVDKATGYVLELYLGTTAGDTPLRTDEATTNSFTYEGLEGETEYFVRVKAVGEAITESKWVETDFETGAEQIFQAVANADLEATQVTLRWPAGEEADVITLTPADVEPYQITPEDIAAGCATITGLTPETEYTAVMTRGEKTRGTVTFTTPMDLGGATRLTPDMDFVAALEGAEAGTVFALEAGTYVIPDEKEAAGKLAISADVTLNAIDADNKPVINGCITLNGGASFTANNIVFDGTGTDGSQAFDWKDEGTYDHLTLNGCEVRNYTKGFFYLNVAALVNTITIDNCLIHDIECSGGDLFDSRKGAYNSFTLSNSTVWNSCAARDFIRFDDASGSFSGVAPVVTVTNCTLDGIGGGDAPNYRILYVRFAGNSIIFTNNIVSNSNYKRGFSDQAKTSVPTFGNNNYWNTVNLVANDGGTGTIFDADGTTLDPGYKDAANGDFTLSNEDLIYEQVGDPRWRQ